MRILAVALALSGCAVPATPPSTPPVVPAARAAAAPGWRPGDQWIYGWTSGTETATKIVEVIEIKQINGTAFYLLRAGDLEHFWTRDLEWAGSMRNQKVESRMTPPEPLFVWPLEPGRRWDHRGIYEDPSGKKQANDSFSVAGVEVVETPAGRFNAFKVVRETDSRDSDQYWYVPEVRFYVKWIGRRGDMQFEEQLREYRPAARLIPEQPPAGTPSHTR